MSRSVRKRTTYKGIKTMTTMNMFEYAARHQIRFTSVKGLITAEQLWTMPLRSQDGFNLDAVAKAANQAFKSATEESFVNTERTPEHTRLEMALEIVKYVISSKLDDEAAAKKRAANKAEREYLLQVLADKQQDKLTKLSEAELRRRIEALA